MEQLRDLYDDIELDSGFLNEEEILADLLDGKDELSQKAKEKLAELVAEKGYNEYAKAYQLYPYFGCIPLAEVARQFLIGKGITVGGKQLAEDQGVDDEDDKTHDQIQSAIEEYAEEKCVAIKDIVKSAFLKWVDGDLFDRYTPFALSCDEDRELFKRWLSSKAKARTVLKKLIAKGDLKILDDAVITGESLCRLKSEWKFVKDFQESVSTYQPGLGLVYADDDPECKGENLDREFLVSEKDEDGERSGLSMFEIMTHQLEVFVGGTTVLKEVENNGDVTLEFKEPVLEESFTMDREGLVLEYSTLLAFNEILKKLSKIYKIDLTYKARRPILLTNSYITEHNDFLDRAVGKTVDADEVKFFSKHQTIFKIDQKFYIDMKGIESNMERIQVHVENFKEIFGDDF